ncbi:MAG TPA: GNAT family N-acetyltransferase [Mycobacteriales bacterium]|nr:GNAT family N-acetyltransferase [Mycobacteriales bacterium]
MTDPAVAACARGEAAWHRLALAALELPSYEDDGMWWRRDPASPLLFAGVTLERGARLPAAIAAGQVRDSFGDLELDGWTPAPADPWMLRDPAPVPELKVDGLFIDHAVNPDEVWVFERTAIRGAMGEEGVARFEPFSIHGRESGQVPGLRLLLGKLDGVPVATSIAARWKDGVCVSGVMVVESARRRGIGAAMTAAALRAAPTVPASLVASDMGHGIYERLGFRDVGRGLTWKPPA